MCTTVHDRVKKFDSGQKFSVIKAHFRQKIDLSFLALTLE
jgi:hypothetical protein